MKKNHEFFSPAVALIVMLAVMVFPFPIGFRQFAEDPDSALQSDLYDFENHTVIDYKVLPASIIILMRNQNNGAMMYIPAEKSPLFARYRLIAYPQVIDEGMTAVTDDFDDFLYKNEMRIVHQTISARSVFAPRFPVYLLGYWTVFFIAQIVRGGLRLYRSRCCAASKNA